MAATYDKKKGSAAVQSSVATGASGDQRRARRSLNLGGASSSSFYGSQSASGCLLLSWLVMLLQMKEMLQMVDFLSKRCH